MADMGQSTKEKEVNAAMAALEKTITDLIGRANLFVERTHPVRRGEPGINKALAEKTGQVVSSVPLAAQLGEFRARVNDIIGQINTALDQLEI